MNRQSFIDLTALLDVVLILFFAALINLAARADVHQQLALQLEQQVDDMTLQNEQLTLVNAELLAENAAARQELSELYGREMASVVDYRAIISRISLITVELRGDDNQLLVNNEVSSVNIVRENLSTEERKNQLDQKVTRLLDMAIDNRQKSDIIYLKVIVSDREVYKYAVDYLLAQINAAIERYGREKVILSKWQ